ncbi:hypothetical protein SY83_05140 [Paenibacillus swuensis]|uniref:Sortase n=1 Tax=Paenibacillus swuensis TaxID=1178515 RepID=A0A172TNX6_9BACL|nr:hypothetical protein SY83_05140 [Paenibacillus swuensis]
MRQKLLAAFIILTGFMILLYPAVKDRYETYQQNRILEQWQQNMQQIALETTVEDIVEQADLPPDDSDSAATKPMTAQPAPSQKKPPAAEVKLKNVEGVLIINKIDLNLPILTNATKQNLSRSVASIANTGKAGQIGNYAIAGHRNRTYGKNFNRLGEMKIGDVVEVDTGKEKFRYKLTSKEIVLPEEVGVLKGKENLREITLVTCHPMKNPTHRLILKGQIIPNHRS